ncbi:MAG TPA: DUF5658 family protein [Vicinamibacterales bacterium]|nr:DUF5658 family protein [Vicinamibacterales bacterium]
MFRRLPNAVALVALIFAPWSASEARAQERQDVPQLELPATVMAFAQPIRLTETPQRPPAAPQVRIGGSSPMLKSLYASTAIMQGLDVHSTMSVLNRGGGEANPLMAGLVRNKAAFIGVKAAVAASTILAARQIGKRNKVAAVATLVAINSAYALVVQHNYRVARNLR